MIPSDLNSINLGRICPPPNAGSDTSPTYFPPRMFIVGAGAAGLAANLADRASAVPLTRSNQSNTSSPNPVSDVGSASTAGTFGQRVSTRLQALPTGRAITGPGGAPVAPTIVQTPSWLKPALLVAGGFVVGWLVFHG